MAIFLSDPDYSYALSLLRQCLPEEAAVDRPVLLRQVMSILTWKYEYALTLNEIPFQPLELSFYRHLWIPDDTQYCHHSGSYWAVGSIKLHPIPKSSGLFSARRADSGDFAHDQQCGSR